MCAVCDNNKQQTYQDFLIKNDLSDLHIYCLLQFPLDHLTFSLNKLYYDDKTFNTS